MAQPTLRFLSLFVPDLDEARQRYEATFGIQGVSMEGAGLDSDQDMPVPMPHPFAKRGPIVFDLGTCTLALYECDMHATHPGDVGIGVEVGEDLKAVTRRASTNQARVFYGPQPLANQGRKMAVFVLPDRHFFELVSKK